MKLKKIDIIFLSLISFILIILFIVITFNDTLFTYIYNLIHYDYYNRLIDVNAVLDEDEIETLYNSGHVLSVDISNGNIGGISSDEFEFSNR